MTEASIQRRIVKELTAAGAMVWKWESPARRGVPDLIALHRGVVWFMEVKQTNGRLSPAQSRMIEKMRAAGAHVYLVRSVDDALFAWRDALREYGEQP